MSDQIRNRRIAVAIMEFFRYKLDSRTDWAPEEQLVLKTAIRGIEEMVQRVQIVPPPQFAVHLCEMVSSFVNQQDITNGVSAGAAGNSVEPDTFTESVGRKIKIYTQNDEERTTEQIHQNLQTTKERELSQKEWNGMSTKHVCGNIGFENKMTQTEDDVGNLVSEIVEAIHFHQQLTSDTHSSVEIADSSQTISEVQQEATQDQNNSEEESGNTSGTERDNDNSIDNESEESPRIIVNKISISHTIFNE